MISCKAINERSIYVNARGDILPCCYISDRANISNMLKEIIKDPTYKSVVDSWSTPHPHPRCRRFCTEPQSNE